MANQMIALQARAPQSAGIGNAIQQNAQMINMLTQQRAAERQNALAAQKLQLDLETAQRARGKEARDIKAADIALAKNQLEYHSKRATAVRTSQGYSAWLTGVEQDSPEMAEFFKTNLPPEEFDRKELIKMIGGIKENFDATFAPVKEEVTYDLQGYKYRSRTGGFEGQGDYPLDEMELDPTGGAPRGSVELGEQTTVEGGQGGPMLPTPDAPSMPGVNPSRVSTDMAGLLTNARNDAEYQQALGLIGRMNPDAAQSLRQIMPVYDAQLMDSVRAEAQAAFGGENAPPPVTEFPLVAGPRGGPLEGYRTTGRQARGKPLLQSPAPGTNIQTLPRIENEAGAAESGKESAQYIAELRKKLPQAKGAVELATNQLRRDIADVDYVLTNPYREMVVGNVEGKFPGATSFVNIFRSGGQDAQNVQDRLEKVIAASVVKFLQQMKEASPQGSSLFGQVTEYEDRLVSVLAGLKQTQDEATFDRALREYRNILGEMYRNLPRVFNDTFEPLNAKVEIVGVGPPPRNSPTISDVQYLRRNKNNPDVVNGFRKEFGENAYKMAIGGR